VTGAGGWWGGGGGGGWGGGGGGGACAVSFVLYPVVAALHTLAHGGHCALVLVFCVCKVACDPCVHAVTACSFPTGRVVVVHFPTTRVRL